MLKINDLALKLIAIISMVVDHIGAIFFPETEILRIIGRIALPIFIYLLAKGKNRSRNQIFYCSQLLLFGLISQPVYNLFFSNHNILLSFCIYILASLPKNRLIQAGTLGVGAYFLENGNFDYGVWGLMIFKIFEESKIDWKCFLKFSLVWSLGALIMNKPLWIFAIASFPIIVFFQKERGEMNLGKVERMGIKYGFYIFYPLHLALMVIAKAS